MKFQEAVQGTPSISSAYRLNLRALKKAHRAQIETSGSTITGSIDLDSALVDVFPDANRWDYGIGIQVNSSRDGVDWVEVHSAAGSHVQIILNKHRWLKDWLNDQGTLLKNLIHSRFVWIASGKVGFRKGSLPQRRLAAAGILFPGRIYRIKAV